MWIVTHELASELEKLIPRRSRFRVELRLATCASQLAQFGNLRKEAQFAPRMLECGLQLFWRDVAEVLSVNAEPCCSYNLLECLSENRELIDYP